MSGLTNLTIGLTDLNIGLTDLNIAMEAGLGLAKPYTGVTTVIPSVVAQELNTAMRLVSENITVEEIPYSAVGNEAGGYTVSIG